MPYTIVRSLCCSLAFAALGCSPAPSSPDAMEPDPPASGLDPTKSLVITSRVGFREVANPANQLTLGRLLAARHALMNAKRIADGKGSIGPREGTRMAITKLAEDVDEHNAMPSEPPPGRHIGIVREMRNAFRDRILAHWDPAGVAPELPDDQKDGPFRLLAVVNRLDLAGANDNPGGGSTLPEDKRKFFGEGRLVFGLTVPDDAGRPYPMTLIMEYHLPFLDKQVDDAGNVRFVGVEKEFDYDAVSDADWIEQRARWAELWAELSRYPFESAAYAEKLRDIVATFAKPGNSVALRVGQVVDPVDPLDPTHELEYRESYTQAGFLLAPRDHARDVHPCVAEQPFFAALVEERWLAATRDMRFDYKWPAAIREQDQAAIFAACGLPMGAKAGEQGPRVHVSRFTIDKVWPALYGTDPVDYTIDDMEEKRHDFAMTTCSGCHAAETGTRGFMILPRAADADSEVADFLRGPVSVTLPNGASYQYDEIARRAALLAAFSRRGYPGTCPGGTCAAPPPQIASQQEEMLRK